MQSNTAPTTHLLPAGDALSFASPPDHSMTHIAPPSSPQPSHEPIADAVRVWLERAVIGLNLCPFARAPYVNHRVRIAVTDADTDEALLHALDGELSLLRDTAPDLIETTLLVHPQVLTDFDAYNDFLTLADLAVRMRGMQDTLQIASFHPDYRFADSEADDIENYTNRAPYPILHLLRESSVDAAVRAMPDTDEIYRRNMDTLRRLGLSGWNALWQTPEPLRKPSV